MRVTATLFTNDSSLFVKLNFHSDNLSIPSFFYNIDAPSNGAELPLSGYRFEYSCIDNEDGSFFVSVKIDGKIYEGIISRLMGETDLPRSTFNGLIEEDNNLSDYEYVNHPKHYNNFSKEVIDMMVDIWGKEKVADFCELNSFKYRLRMGNKPEQSIEQDLKKAKFYEDKRKELLK